MTDETKRTAAEGMATAYLEIAGTASARARDIDPVLADTTMFDWSLDQVARMYMFVGQPGYPGTDTIDERVGEATSATLMRATAHTLPAGDDGTPAQRVERAIAMIADALGHRRFGVRITVDIHDGPTFHGDFGRQDAPVSAETLAVVRDDGSTTRVGVSPAPDTRAQWMRDYLVAHNLNVPEGIGVIAGETGVDIDMIKAIYDSEALMISTATATRLANVLGHTVREWMHGSAITDNDDLARVAMHYRPDPDRAEFQLNDDVCVPGHGDMRGRIERIAWRGASGANGNWWYAIVAPDGMQYDVTETELIETNPDFYARSASRAPGASWNRFWSGSTLKG